MLSVVVVAALRAVPLVVRYDGEVVAVGVAHVELTGVADEHVGKVVSAATGHAVVGRVNNGLHFVEFFIDGEFLSLDFDFLAFVFFVVDDFLEVFFAEGADVGVLGPLEDAGLAEVVFAGVQVGETLDDVEANSAGGI